MMDHSNDPEHQDDYFEGFSVEYIKNKFKALGTELDNSVDNLSDLFSNSENKQENSKIIDTPYFRDYIPTIYDFLARAITDDDCKEIIDYCLEKGEINQKVAKKLLYRLEKGGPRAFGTRNPGYYDNKL